jgi:hypothetical protein
MAVNITFIVNVLHAPQDIRADTLPHAATRAAQGFGVIAVNGQALAVNVPCRCTLRYPR